MKQKGEEMSKEGDGKVVCFAFKLLDQSKSVNTKIENHEMGMGRNAFILYLYTHKHINMDTCMEREREREREMGKEREREENSRLIKNVLRCEHGFW